MLRTSALSDVGRTALQVAAVTGVRFGLDLVEHLAGESSGLDELLERQILVEVEPGVGAFRDALVREAVYTATPWGRRRALHRAAAEHLEAQRAPPGLVAEHWIAARASDRARHALIAAVEAFCAVHAYRDAARAARQALDLWTHEAGAEAAWSYWSVWAIVPKCLVRCPRRRRHGARPLTGGGRLATCCAWLQPSGAWPRCASYKGRGNRRWRPTWPLRTRTLQRSAREAAAERLAVAGHLRLAASYNAALPLLEVAQREAEEAVVSI